MSEEREATSRQQAGADAESAPVGEPEIIDAEVVEEADPVEAVLDAEVVDEDGDGVHGAEAAVEEIEDAEDAPTAASLADVLRERDEYLGLAQRARADFENYKRRAATQATEAERRGRAGIARALLPAIDNLQRALAAAGADAGNGAGDADEVAKGFSLVYGELRSALERSGVNAFDPVGEKFDPNVHEAISTAPADGVEPGTVVETLELGYTVDDQVIRPARVVVSG